MRVTSAFLIVLRVGQIATRFGGKMSNSATANGKLFVCAANSGEASESHLVQAAKRGHAQAFSTLCQRYSQQLLRATTRITRCHEDAEDAVQDALMRGFVHLKDFDGRSSFGTWLTRIAINSALMILRKKRSSLETAIESSDDPANGVTFEIPDNAPSPERIYAQSEEKKMLRKAVQRLRPSLRNVVAIQQLQERSMRETADAMGISVAAAKARLFHAKLALRKSPMLKFMRRRRSVPAVRALRELNAA